uniref:hypothetical protein n=1 Tax=Nocardia suismassiliense TaxID=2077092 RepID=UPI003F497106
MVTLQLTDAVEESRMDGDRGIGTSAAGRDVAEELGPVQRCQRATDGLRVVAMRSTEVDELSDADPVVADPRPTAQQLQHRGQDSAPRSSWNRLTGSPEHPITDEVGIGESNPTPVPTTDPRTVCLHLVAVG